MWERAELKQRAKICFKRNYWAAVIVCLVLFLLQYAAGVNSNSAPNPGSSNEGEVTEYTADQDTLPMLKEYAKQYFYSESGAGMLTPVITSTILFYGILLAILRICLNYFILNPLYVGMAGFFYRNRTEKASVGELAVAFNRNDFLPIVKTMFLRGLYIFLWTCLLIIPGFIKSYEYRMVDYILAEYPDMPTREVLNRSRKMMLGHKWDTFILDLSFFGWAFLGAVIPFGLLNILWTNPYMRATDAELYAVLKTQVTAEASQADVF